MVHHKVFCLGFQKTGTSSIGVALNQLGYTVAGYYPFRHHADQKGIDLETVWRTALPVAQSNDAVQDTPWPILYDRLDRAFPGAKFINVIRPREAWIESAVADFGKHHNEIHRLIYGSDCPVGNEEAWLARYDRHNREIADYFRDRPDDFLLLDVSDGGRAWQQLCGFLGHPVPNRPWPHANKRHVKRLKLFWWRQCRRLRL